MKILSLSDEQSKMLLAAIIFVSGIVLIILGTIFNADALLVYGSTLSSGIATYYFTSAKKNTTE